VQKTEQAIIFGPENRFGYEFSDDQYHDGGDQRIQRHLKHAAMNIDPFPGNGL